MLIFFYKIKRKTARLNVFLFAPLKLKTDKNSCWLVPATKLFTVVFIKKMNLL